MDHVVQRNWMGGTRRWVTERRHRTISSVCAPKLTFQPTEVSKSTQTQKKKALKLKPTTLDFTSLDLLMLTADSFIAQTNEQIRKEAKETNAVNSFDENVFSDRNSVSEQNNTKSVSNTQSPFLSVENTGRNVETATKAETQTKAKTITIKITKAETQSQTETQTQTQTQTKSKAETETETAFSHSQQQKTNQTQTDKSVKLIPDKRVVLPPANIFDDDQIVVLESQS